MKLRRVEAYDAGYCGTDNGVTLKKAVAVTAAAAAMLGGLTGCFRNSLAGDTEYYPQEYDGYMAVESVSETDISGNCSSQKEMFTLDGDVVYVPSDQG